MARIKRYSAKAADGTVVERYLVLFRHRGKETPAGTFEELELALVEKARAERAKRDGRVDEYAAGLLEEPDTDLTLWEFMRLTIERSKRVPAIVHQWLVAWREVAAASGLPAGDRDFIIPGAATDGHFSLNQHKRWGGKYFHPAACAVADAHPEFAYLARATPYSARRGHITCRILAGEPVEIIARSCGTSPATIHRHYFVVIDAAESGHRLPPFEQQLADATELTDDPRTELREPNQRGEPGMCAVTPAPHGKQAQVRRLRSQPDFVRRRRLVRVGGDDRIQAKAVVLRLRLRRRNGTAQMHGKEQRACRRWPLRPRCAHQRRGVSDRWISACNAMAESARIFRSTRGDGRVRPRGAVH
jgi:hypothetical protein